MSAATNFFVTQSRQHGAARSRVEGRHPFQALRLVVKPPVWCPFHFVAVRRRTQSIPAAFTFPTNRPFRSE
jgi:hypothetical protein